MLVVSEKDLEDDVEAGQGTPTGAAGSESGAGVASGESVASPESPTGGSPETPTTELAKPEEGLQGKGADGGHSEGQQPLEKKVFSKQQKIDHAFAEIKAKSQRRIQALEAQIAELKNQSGKAIPKKEEFKSEDEYFDARAEAIQNKKALESKSKELSEEQSELNAQREQEKFETHYPTEENQKRFLEAWGIGQSNGVVKAIHENEVVSSFLGDSDISPKLIEHFCRKPEALQKILSIRDVGRKQNELYSLEQRMKSFLRNQNLKQPTPSKQAPATPPAKPTADNKPKIPILGSQQKAQNNRSGDADDFEKESDIFDFVRGK